MKKKRVVDIWTFMSVSILLMYFVFLLYPLYMILNSSFTGPDGGFSLHWFNQFFSQSYYLSTLTNSFSVTIWTTILTLIIGYILAYFYNMFEIKGKGFLQVLIILSSMSAPFIGAYAWIQLLGRAGIITVAVKNIFGFTMPNIYGFNGILLVLTLQLFPLVFLYISGALKKVDNSLLEASANMGVSGIRRFFKIIVPLTMPTIFAAGLLVFMRAFADFGTPLLIGEGYRVFPVEIYNQFMGEVGRNYNFAATISVIAILITTVIFVGQKFIADRFSFTMNSLNTIERKKAKGIFNIFIHFYSYSVVLLSFLPQILIVYQSFQNTSGKLFAPGFSLNSYIFALNRMKRAIPNTFYIGGIALAITIILAIFIAYLVVRRKNAINNVIDTMSMIPYIIPGSVVGIGLVMAFNRKPIVLTGTVIIMVIALVIRRIPYTIRSSVAILQQIPITIEEASISLGASKMKTFFKITVPMMSSGVIAGAILSWVTIITELATAIILYNASTITLTLSIYSFVSRGNYGYAAALATVLSALTTVSLLIYMKFTKSGEITL
ncbi:MAG: iron ABC transporter permease [Firmicutes bacterium GWF2_51_9]|nr:iron ABC transporter permease [Erysipelotrichaceae bacterium]OGS54991.1 MAG: iron ABC transporter permease [Firmicutes bacterium GWF2_51_9]OGS58500.1 MAG: iron ABC transporter permease [Firmicutes bacterium GWE2_51_13]HAM62621.1 iron ABC transporter permease [Erysipelotrichaceae bacterium]HAO62432.1 iron ABC transporter permease [Erysipelotrichaceae bacterium]